MAELTSAEQALLQAEIQNNPLNLDFSTDVLAADAINEKNRSSYRKLDSQELLRWAADESRAASIRKAANEHPVPQVQSIAIVADQILMRDNATMNLSDTDVQSMVASLVTAGVIKQSDSDALYALAATQVSRASELGLPHITPSNVANARA